MEFQNESGVWVGNFMGGATGFTKVFEGLDGRSVIVIARGQGYLVDVDSRKVSTFGGSLTDLAYRGVDRFVFSTFTDLEAYGTIGIQWRTRRLSFDGFRSFRVENGSLEGEAWTPIGDKWARFSVDLSTGEATGGAYP